MAEEVKIEAVSIHPTKAFCMVKVNGDWIRFENTDEVNKVVQEAVEVNTKMLTEKIGELTRRLHWAEDSEMKRSQGLARAKEQAGRQQYESFDNVWADALKALKENPLHTQTFKLPSGKAITFKSGLYETYINIRLSVMKGRTNELQNFVVENVGDLEVRDANWLISVMEDIERSAQLNSNSERE